MANPYINIYKDNPTAGAKDGTPVSTDGVYTAPITAILNKGKVQTTTVKLAIRTENGYGTINRTEIYTQNVTDDISTAKELNNVKLSWSQNTGFTSKITTEEMITSANKIFYAKFSMSDSEAAQVDTSLRFVIIASITTVN